MSTVTDPNSPATKKQTFYIFTLGGGDVRSKNLTKSQAAEMIEELLKNKPVKGSKKNSNSNSDNQISDKDAKFENIFNEATDAANKAGDLWMKNAKPMYRVVQRASPLDDRSPVVRDFGTMLDVCGFAYVEIDDKRTSFAKWAIKNLGAKGYLPVRHKYVMRQELGLKEACARAALQVLYKHEIKGVSLYSRID